MDVKTIYASDLDATIDIITEIVLRTLFQLYGALGCEEFSIQKFKYRRQSDTWKVSLIRRVDGLVLNYTLVIDNVSGQVVEFERK